MQFRRTQMEIYLLNENTIKSLNDGKMRNNFSLFYFIQIEEFLLFCFVEMLSSLNWARCDERVSWLLIDREENVYCRRSCLSHRRKISNCAFIKLNRNKIASTIVWLSFIFCRFVTNCVNEFCRWESFLSFIFFSYYRREISLSLCERREFPFRPFVADK